MLGPLKLFQAFDLLLLSFTCFVYILFRFDVYVRKRFDILSLCTLSGCFHFVWQPSTSSPMFLTPRFFLHVQFAICETSEDSRICYSLLRFPFLYCFHSFHLKTPFTLKIFWDDTSYSLIEIYRRFGETYCLYLHSQKVSHVNQKESDGKHSLGLLFDPEMETVPSSVTLANFSETTRRHIPEDSALYRHRCENLIYCIRLLYLFHFII
jgi:hypothetical protein